MLRDKKIAVLLWVVLILCIIAPNVAEERAQFLDEVTTSIVFLVLAISTDKVVAYFMLALSVGKLADGRISPNEMGPSELLYIFTCVAGAIALYYYRIKKSFKNGSAE